MSNVRQIVLGLTLYGTDNRNWLPPAEESVGTGAGGTKATWHVRIWQNVMQQTFPLNDYSGGGTYSYLKQTVFECPQANQSRSGGYSTTDFRRNGYAFNISIKGSNGQTGMSFPNQIVRVTECKRLDAARNPASTLILTDSTKFYVEYYDRGSALNSMDAGFGDGGGMLNALGRHGKDRDKWNIAFFDGSVRPYQFSQVPGPPLSPKNYYLVANRQTPAQVLSNVDFPEETRSFWVGKPAD